jgi:Zn-dependent protease with chaperone function
MRKISTLRLNVILFLSVWGLCCIYGILSSLELSCTLLKIVLIISVIVLPILFRHIYGLSKHRAIILEGYIKFGDNMYIGFDEILSVYEVLPLEKALYTIKSPSSDYSEKFFRNGLIIKTMFDSFLIDDPADKYIDKKKVRKVNKGCYNLVIFYALLLFPPLSATISLYAKIDPIIYAAIIVLFIFLGVMRFIPAFYLGSKIDAADLHVTEDEAKVLENIVIIKGFVFTDMYSTVPFYRAQHLDGLAVDGIVRKYIVLNPRLFEYNCKDYLRFVLFHELSHIKHHDGAGAFAVPVFIIAASLILSSLSPNIQWISNVVLPYSDYILLGIAAAYFVVSLLRRKKIEKRADMQGIFSIGAEGVERIRSELGIDLLK